MSSAARFSRLKEYSLTNLWMSHYYLSNLLLFIVNKLHEEY